MIVFKVAILATKENLIKLFGTYIMGYSLEISVGRESYLNFILQDPFLIWNLWIYFITSDSK